LLIFYFFDIIFFLYHSNLFHFVFFINFFKQSHAYYFFLLY